jgi:NAD(P)-dependent dehydrogenase (short-subunit alcohol dehydrogenase family)
MPLPQRYPQLVAGAARVRTPVHAFFNCAGLPGPPFSDLDVMLVNFVGARHLIEQVLPKMPEGSAIAYVASNAGLGWQQHLGTELGQDPGGRLAHPGRRPGDDHLPTVVAQDVLHAVPPSLPERADLVDAG